jgi:hypothetical protein
MQVVEDAIAKCGPTFQAGLEKKLSNEEVTGVLTTLLWEITNNSDNKLVEIRDMEQIAKKGTFRYSGKAETMRNENLLPEDVFQELKTLPGNKDDTRHVGPSYLRVKGLLTQHDAREFFGTQTAFRILDHLEEHPLLKPQGYVVCSPNMTGGVYIGDETGKKLRKVAAGTKVNAWSATPYLREQRKAIDTIASNDKIENYWEGYKPTIEEAGLVVCFEELRTAAETTKNATELYRHFGYNEENGVQIGEGSLFDYVHPVGAERMKRLNVVPIYAVSGDAFFKASLEKNYINKSQFETAEFWINKPWEFTKEVAPLVRKLA